MGRVEPRQEGIARDFAPPQETAGITENAQVHAPLNHGRHIEEPFATPDAFRRPLSFQAAALLRSAPASPCDTLQRPMQCRTVPCLAKAQHCEASPLLCAALPYSKCQCH